MPDPTPEEQTQTTTTTEEQTPVVDNTLGTLPVPVAIDKGVRGTLEPIAVATTIAAIEGQLDGALTPTKATLALNSVDPGVQQSFSQVAGKLAPTPLTAPPALTATATPAASGLANVDAAVCGFAASIDAEATSSLTELHEKVTSSYTNRFERMNLRFGTAQTDLSEVFTRKSAGLAAEAARGKKTLEINASRTARELTDLVRAVASGVRRSLATMKTELIRSGEELLTGINEAETAAVDALVAECREATVKLAPRTTWQRLFSFDQSQWAVGPEDAQRLDVADKRHATAQAYSDAIEKVRADAAQHRDQVRTYYTNELKRLETSVLAQNAQKLLLDIETSRVELETKAQQALNDWDKSHALEQDKLGELWAEVQANVAGSLQKATGELTKAANDELKRLTENHQDVVDNAGTELANLAARLTTVANARRDHEAALQGATDDAEKAVATEALSALSASDKALAGELAASQKQLNRELWGLIKSGANEASTQFRNNLDAYEAQIDGNYASAKAELEGLTVELEAATELPEVPLDADAVHASIANDCTAFVATVGEVKTALLADFKSRLDATVLSARSATALIPDTAPRPLLKSISAFLTTYGIPMLGTAITGVAIALLGGAGAGLAWYVAGPLGGLIGQQITKMITNVSGGSWPWAHLGKQPLRQHFVEVVTASIAGLVAAAGAKFVIGALLAPGTPVPFAAQAAVKGIMRTIAASIAMAVNVPLLRLERLSREETKRLAAADRAEKDTESPAERIKRTSESERGIKPAKTPTVDSEYADKMVLNAGGQALRVALLGLIAALTGFGASLM